jgi:hypothetical protein
MCRLFYSYNHPTWPIYSHLSQRLAAKLGIGTISDQLSKICSTFDSFYLPQDAHPWAQVNSTITPYLREHPWGWIVESIDEHWKEKYAVVLRFLMRG